MSKTDTIEVDEGTAAVLKARAAERGVSVSELVSELLTLDAATTPDDIAELDRRWAEIKAGAPTVPHEDVVRWLKTWGIPDFKPWPTR
jgi:predicted transcriptional regulator